MRGSYLGNEFKENEIIEKLNEIGANYETLSQNEIINKTVNDLARSFTVLLIISF